MAASATTYGGRLRLKRESEMLAAVRDPRVARFIAADVLAPQPWVAMEYVAGPSLAEVRVPLEPAPLRQLADGLAEALAALHSNGLAHRDLKPGNVILTFDGPVLVDLGIAASAELTSITATGVAVGTPAWMAPEQIATGVAGQPADIWGWGSVVFYASTGPSHSPPDRSRS
jgi:serine/threonine protein kinase